MYTLPMNIEIPELEFCQQGRLSFPDGYTLITTEHLFNTYKNTLPLIISGRQFIFSNSTEELLDYVKFWGKNLNLRGFIAFGGGRVIDSSKYIAKLCNVPYFSVPTALSNDGICSPVTVLKQNNQQVRFGTELPKKIIIPIDIISQAPYETFAAGIGDLLSNHSALADWRLAEIKNAEPLNEFAYMFSKSAYLEIEDMIFDASFCSANIVSSDFIKTLSQGLILSGLAMSIAGNSRPASGAEHLISHAIDSLVPNNKLVHGSKVAFGSLVSEYLRSGLTFWIKDIHQKIGLPVTWKDLCLDKSIIIQALIIAKSMNPDRYTILNEVDMTEAKAQEIVEALG